MPGKSDISAVFRVADLPQNRATSFELRPAAAALEKIAVDLGLLGLRKLLFKGTLSASGSADWVLQAHLGATVIQPCVLTLDPVTTRLEVDVERHFLADMPDLGDEEEVEMPEDENAEPLGTMIDVSAIMTESLALNLPLYPRSEGAALDETVFTEPGKQAMTDEDARPFAGLAALRDKLSDEGGK
ncbi:YceD family protein [Shimia aestuarii]|uniref:Uncharacterized metal-binding protein YceD, DUF177 family n=1 Tax=Shimia aestuarii TaxID=254406 RepID=A0A1I4NDD2_9RHOB|nr:DUF177 domain-containing protein [Shimia aestuarii]SFM13300.1 Uncharacterized metal-binding protein YceD, DUF177 family [Shimia aestuarii]